MRYSRHRTPDAAPAAPVVKVPARAVPAVGNQALLRRALDSPSQALAPASPVRLHTGAAAAEAAEGLHSDAFTIGRHVVLSPRVPPSPLHPTVIHESIHARQQGFAEAPADLASLTVNAPGSPQEQAAARHSLAESSAPLAIARQPAAAQGSAPVMPAISPSFSEIYKKFKGTSDLYAAAEKRAFALQSLAALTQLTHAREGGAELMDYFFSQGMTTEGERVMKHVVDLWIIEHVSRAGGVPAPVLVRSGPPGTLQREAESAARAGNHELAFRLFGNAFLLLSFQADDAAGHREKETTATPVIASTTRAMFYYPSLGHVYKAMRDILGYYHTLAAEARGAGDSARAARLDGLASALYEEIRGKCIWASDPQVVSEVELVSTARGDALRIHGDNAAAIDVTALPGLDPPREVTATGATGSLTAQWQSAGDLTEALHNQVELLTELRGTPEIQKEFGATDIDINNLDHRLRIWRTMLGVYTARGSSGGNPLAALMDLIHRYLRAFTLHTSYNVDDFGRSYLADNLANMPQDLAGRLERDCGVYALTVAYEVFRTARASRSPRLDLSFRVFTLPDHVTLVIDDRGRKEYYVVNNDQVTGPKQGDPMGEIAGQYAALRKVQNLVTPAVEMTLGDTSLTDAQFRNQAWDRYRDSASWGLNVPAVSDRETAYRTYYEEEKAYDQDLNTLEVLLDRLRSDLSPLGSPAQLALLDSRAPRIAEGAARLLVTFLLHGPVAGIATSRPDARLQARLAAGQRFLFTNRSAGRDHPLARVAMMLALWQGLGHTFDPVQQTFWNDFARLGTRSPELASLLADYIARRGGASF